MRNSDITYKALAKMIVAMAVDGYELKLIPDDDHQGMRIKVMTYSRGQLLRSVGYLRHENMNGYHVFGRPASTRFALIDDLDQDALDRLDNDGLTPSLVVKTSPGNFQAWITLLPVEIPLAVSTAATRILAERYGGDIRSAHAQHIGRLPGFTNRKRVHLREDGFYPFTHIHGKPWRGVPPGAATLLAEAEASAALEPNPFASTACSQGGCALVDLSDLDPFDSPMTPDEGQEIYDAEVDCAIRSKAGTDSDPSRAVIPIYRGQRFLRIAGSWRRDVIDPAG